MNTDWASMVNNMIWVGLGIFGLYLAARLIFTAYFITKDKYRDEEKVRLKVKRDNLFPDKTRGER